MTKFKLYTKAARAKPTEKRCHCGAQAVAFSCGGYVCANCRRIEARLDHDFVRAGFTRSPFAKYRERAFAVTMPGFQP